MRIGDIEVREDDELPSGMNLEELLTAMVDKGVLGELDWPEEEEDTPTIPDPELEDA